MIETVLGSIAASSTGITMCHEHLALDLSNVRGDKDSCFTDAQLIATELAKLKLQGCGTVVEVTCNDMGRDVHQLASYSRQCGVHIVASTGFYLQPYHPEWVYTASVDEVAALFLAELEQGIAGSDIRAGLVAEIATSADKVHPTERKVFEAAAIAAKETGCAVSTHCDMGRGGDEQVELLTRSGVHPSKIILGHTDLVDDRGYHLALLRSGVNLAFDTIGKTKYLPDAQRADNMTALISEGYEDQLLLSQDVSRLSYLTAADGYGYTAVLGYFTALLRVRGVTATQLDKLLVHNPARILDQPERN